MEINNGLSSAASGNTPLVKNANDSVSTVSLPKEVAQVSTSSQDLLRKEKFELTISEEAVVKSIERANKAIQGVDKRFEYSVHQKSGEVVIKVLNKETNEVIREIPPEKFLDLVDKLQEICGIIIDEKR